MEAQQELLQADQTLYLVLSHQMVAVVALEEIVLRMEEMVVLVEALDMQVEQRD